MKKLSRLVVAFLFFTTIVKAQTALDFFAETRLTIQSQDKFQKLFETSTEYSLLVLNMTNGDFQITADLLKFTTGDAKQDSILISKGSQPLTFKGNISENLFLFNQQINDEKLYNMPGQLTIGNYSINCVAQFDPVNYADRTDVRNYRIDFYLTLEPGKLIIPGLEGKINKQLVMTVKGGKLNIVQ